MDEWELRLKCLELAKGDTAMAESMYNWIRHRTDSARPSGSSKAEVVGRDGELKKPFSDYLKGE